MGDSMERNLVINKIHTVFEGEFNPGFISRKTVGRHCDCFVYFIYGNVNYLFDGYSFNANLQNFICLAKDSAYDIHILEKSKFICIDFDFADGFNKKSEAFKNNASALKISFSKMFYLWNQKLPWSVSETFSILYSLYSDAIKATNQKYAGKNNLLSGITAYILSHYTEIDFSVKAVAEYSGISETHLRRIFKQDLNISPIKYINCLKLDKAKNMLQNSNYTINEIALSVGFDDPYYFSRLFKRETGLSPSEYKKNNKGF